MIADYFAFTTTRAGLCRPGWSNFLAHVDSAEVNLVFMGPETSGKSSLIMRFLSGNFVTAYDPTIMDPFRKDYKFSAAGEDRLVTLNILDTAGQETFKYLRDQWMKKADAFCFGFSVDSSFSRLSDFINVFFHEMFWLGC